MYIEAYDLLQMILSMGAIKQSAVPMPKTTRMRAMRHLRDSGLAISEHGYWRLSGAGRSQWAAARQPIDTSFASDNLLDTIDIDIHHNNTDSKHPIVSMLIGH